jgi:Domain of unknown function (DUF3854)
MPPTLLPQHQKLIDASGIAPVAVEARGYRSVTKKAELRGLGFGDNQRRVPALLIPVRNVTGEIATYQIRPDEPRVVDGKPLKYETPGASRMFLDVPTGARPKLGHPKIPLFITEGARKTDAAVSHGLCCVSLLGVWNWRGTNEWAGKTALSDWESVALNNGRQVYIVFDSDVMQKPAVHAALRRLKAFLELRGANVMVIYLPHGPGGAKVGLDDYLAAGHTTQGLVGLAQPELFPLQEETSGPAPYRETDRAGLDQDDPRWRGRDVLDELLRQHRRGSRTRRRRGGASELRDRGEARWSRRAGPSLCPAVLRDELARRGPRRWRRGVGRLWPQGPGPRSDPAVERRRAGTASLYAYRLAPDRRTMGVPPRRWADWAHWADSWDRSRPWRRSAPRDPTRSSRRQLAPRGS